jgi:hypothetical protein
MSILDRLRRRLDTFSSLLPVLPGADDGPLAFSAEIPGGLHGSLLKFDLRIDSEPHGDGERVRLRAHVQTNFASVLRPMLSQTSVPKDATISDSRALAPAARVGRLAQRSVRRALANRVVRRLAEPLLQNDVNTWIEVQASTASLDAGAHDLVPQNEKLAALGIRPARREGAHVENWSGAAGNGYAQVSLLQLDKSSLPPRLARRLGDQPFNLAAMVVNTVEEK